MTESNILNIVYEDLTPDFYQPGNDSASNLQFDVNHWWAEVQCLDGIFLPSGKFVHAVPDVKMTYNEASSMCDKLGLDLVLPETARENTYINEYLSGNGFYLRICLTSEHFKPLPYRLYGIGYTIYELPSNSSKFLASVH